MSEAKDGYSADRVEAGLPAMTAQQSEFTSSKKSAIKLYRELVVGTAGIPFWLWYELLTMGISGLAGIAGLGLRAALYPTLLGQCGARPAIGRGVVLRNPRAVSLGNKVLIDDYAALDVRGKSGNIKIGDRSSIGRYSTIVAKEGTISLGCGVNIGSYCRIATQSSLYIGESTLVAAYAYVGPGNHQRGDSGAPLISRPMDIKGGVNIGSHCWIGAHATILDGVTIGDGAIVGAHALVKDNVAAGTTVVGVPARPIS